MKKYFLKFVCFGLFAALPTLAAEANLLDAGDAAFLGRVNEVSARKSLEIYRDVFRDKKSDATAWRVAMAAYFVGFRNTPTRIEKIKLFGEGRDAALLGIALNPDCAACHFWAAVNMALYGDSAGILKMLFSLGDVQDHLRKVIALDPTYMHAGAYRILGLIDLKLPGILGGSKERALEYFKTAAQLTPTLPLNTLFLAQWYDHEGDKVETNKIASRVLNLAVPPQRELEEYEAYLQLQKLYERDQPSPVRKTASSVKTVD